MAGTGFRFHLRAGARFQDGVTVTASDVAFELNRLARKSTNSSLAHLLKPVVGYDQVHGTSEATDRPCVKVEDPRTLVITIAQPWYEFPCSPRRSLDGAHSGRRVPGRPRSLPPPPHWSGPYALAPGSHFRATSSWSAPSILGAATVRDQGPLCERLTGRGSR